MRHRPELDGLRGVAVLIVLGAHVGVPGVIDGQAGVTLFFSLSGFLITSLLLAELERTGRVSLPRFYVRRALRLLPALFAYVLLVIIIYGAGWWTVARPDGLAIAAVLAYVGNWAMVAGGLTFGVLGHTWSLAVEEQFYLFWPVLLLVALRLGGRRSVAIAVVGLALIVTPWRMFLWSQGAAVHVLDGTDTHLDAILIGCAIALLRVSLPGRAGWLGVLGTIGLGSVLATGLPPPFSLSLGALAAGVAVAGCPRVLAPRGLVYVGRISYGIYLWHYLFLWSGLPWPVAIVVSLAVAAASYELLEAPFLRLKERFASSAGHRAVSGPTALALATRPQTD